MAVKNFVQLITYPDSLGGNLSTLHDALVTHFDGLFPGGVHILPPFPSSGDRGFSPLTYFDISPEFGTWADIQRIGEQFDVLVDLMVNHVSRQSVYFQDFAQHGRQSKYADLFITLDKIWPDGKPSAEDVAKIFLRKPDHPFSDIPIADTGNIERIWTSFGQKDWAEQIDLDIRSPLTRKLLTDILTFFSQQRISIVRLDAVGYITKKPGTSCFFVEPEIYEFMEWIQGVADTLNISLLPEVHAHYSIQAKLAEHGYWVYDFVLPLLILHTLLATSSRKLQTYLTHCPRRQFTMLDCHDGIPVQPDLDGILTMDESKRVVEHCLRQGANLNRILTKDLVAHGFDAHQINCTYYSALNGDDDAYLAARAIQLFAPGVPQVYYVGLLAGQNDAASVARTNEGRAINRHNYSMAEIQQAVQQPVVQRLFALLRFRNHHPAFHGDFAVQATSDAQVTLTWQLAEQRCQLSVDLHSRQSMITYTTEDGTLCEYRV